MRRPGILSFRSSSPTTTTRKRLLLFLVVSVVDAPLIIGGSIAGAALGGRALFVGAFIGGIIGVLVAARLAFWLKLLSVQNYRRTAIGGVAGFLVAAAIATSNLHTPVIPALSGLL